MRLPYAKDQVAPRLTLIFGRAIVMVCLEVNRIILVSNVNSSIAVRFCCSFRARIVVEESSPAVGRKTDRRFGSFFNEKQSSSMKNGSFLGRKSVQNIFSNSLDHCSSSSTRLEFTLLV